MHDLQHYYLVNATAGSEGDVTLTADSAMPIPSAPPPQYGGPGDRWSPESLLVAAVADCFILTFRAVARGSKLTWGSLQCDVEGTLERIDGVTRFTAFKVDATLEIPEVADEAKALRLLEKAEANCLITNSLSGKAHLNAAVKVAQ